MAVKKKLTARAQKVQDLVSDVRKSAKERRNRPKLKRAPRIQSAAASESARRRSLGGLPKDGGAIKVDMNILKRGLAQGQTQQASGGKSDKAKKGIKLAAKFFGG